MFEKFLGKKGMLAVMLAALMCLMLDARALAAALSISTPSNGATISGMVTVTLSLGSSAAWANVYVDGVYQNSTPPNFFYWQTTGVSNGSHTISATAFNSSGGTLGSTSATVTVANGGAVSLTSPSNGSAVSGTVTVNLTTGPSTAWANVYLNGAYQASTPPDYFYWDTTGVSNGQYKLSATAFDSNGNNLGSSQSTVTVANGGASINSSSCGRAQFARQWEYRFG